jgi:hypothetical protein
MVDDLARVPTTVSTPVVKYAVAEGHSTGNAGEEGLPEMDGIPESDNLQKYIDYLWCTSGSDEQDPTFETLSKFVAVREGGLDSLVSALEKKYQTEYSQEELHIGWQVFLKIYELLPVSSDTRILEARLLRAAFRTRSRFLAEEAASNRGIATIGGTERILHILERRGFPKGYGLKSLEKMKASMTEFEYEPYWQQLIARYRTTAGEHALLAIAGREAEIPKAEGDSPFKSWAERPIYYYDIYRSLRILDGLHNTFGSSYVDFLQDSRFPAWKATEVWISERWRSEAYLARFFIAGGESSMRLLAAALDIEKSAQAGGDARAASAIAASYLDGYTGKPLKYTQANGKHILACRTTDRFGRYYTTLHYKW